MDRTPGRSGAGGVADLTRRLRAAGCVFAEDEARLLLEAAGDRALLATLVERRVAGEPLEHLLGWAEFCGLRLQVTAGVFVPRQRTALLVEQAVSEIRRVRGGHLPVVVDLCCGSGAVGAAVAALAGPVHLHAVDVDGAAVRCARRNLAAVGGRVHHGDLFRPLPSALRGMVDVLLVNAPYVPRREIRLMPPEARLYEPAVALDGGSDGLDVLRRIAAGATQWLAHRGMLLVETSRRQALRLVQVLAAADLAGEVVESEELAATMVRAHPRP